MEPFVPPAGSSSWWTTILGAGLFAKAVLLILFIFSVISWTIIIKKIRLFRRIKRENKTLLSLFQHRRSALQFQKLTTEYKNTPLAKILARGLYEWDNLKKPSSLTNPTPTQKVTTQIIPSSALAQLLPNINDAMNRTSSFEFEQIERSLPFLATISSVSPFLGLLGTVWGVLSALLNVKNIPIVTLQIIAPGVSDALVTTVAGLIVAIPALIFYNYFIGKLRDISTESERFISAIISDFRKEIVLSNLK
jgi:biopolymer transport protein TolQ